VQQGPVGILGGFDFDAFPGDSYVERCLVKESFCFNETHLASISQLDRVRHSTAD
jgi:hypothetical protein